MADATLEIRLPYQMQSVTAVWLVPNFTSGLPTFRRHLKPTTLVSTSLPVFHASLSLDSVVLYKCIIIIIIIIIAYVNSLPTIVSEIGLPSLIIVSIIVSMKHC